MNPRIFLISFNKCGTSSFHSLFEMNGIASRHHGGNNPRKNLAINLFNNFNAARDPLENIDEYIAYTDMSFADDRRILEGMRLFAYIHRHYPQSYFILATRDVDRWIDSRMHHGRGDYAARWKSAYNIDSDERLSSIWRRQYDEHRREVLEYFGARPAARFLEFDLETDAPALIGEFLENDFGIDMSHWGQRNVTSAGVRKVVRERVGDGS